MTLTKAHNRMIAGAFANVLDYGADPTGVTDSTTKIQAAINAETNIYFPAGTYLITAALEIPSNRVLHGATRQSSVIKRLDGVQQTIDGVAVGVPILYISGTWVDVENLRLTGIVTDTTAIRFSALGANSHVNFTHLEINFCYHSFVESQGFFMTSFNNINCAQVENAFTFNSNFGKTSLTLNNCYASSCGQAYDFVNTVYSVMNACGTDYANHPTEGGYGDPATIKGVYNFLICDMVINGCGAEGAYGNGVINATSSSLTINNITSYSCRSQYVPDYATYPDYAIGPVQLGLSWNKITASDLSFLDWQNTVVNASYPTKPVGDKVGYNSTIVGFPSSIFLHPSEASDFAGQSYTDTETAIIIPVVYKEGTWTPVGNNITLAAASGIWTRIGRTVTFSAQVTFPVTSDGNPAFFTGLPFVANASSASMGNGSIGSSTYASPMTGRVLNGYDRWYNFAVGGALLSNVNLSGTTIEFGGTYIV